MARGTDGVGLVALALGSALMYAGIKGYSLLAVLENLVVGKPIHTNVNMTNPLTLSPGELPSGAPSGLIDPPLVERR